VLVSAAPVLAQTSSPTPTQTQVSQVLVEGRVVDAAGLPLAGALVGVNVFAQIPTTGVQSGADGSYSLPVLVGSRVIQAVLAGYTQLTVPTVNASGTTTSAPDLVMYTNDATVSGTVRDGSGGGSVSGALVVLGYQDGSDLVEAWSDANGVYKFAAVSGTYATVALAQFGGAYQERTRVTRPYSVTAGSTTVDLVLPRLSISGSPCTTSPCQMTISGDGYVPGEPVSLLLLVQSGQVNPPANIALGQTVPDSLGQIAGSWLFAASPASYQLQAVEDTVPYTPTPPDMAIISVGPYVVQAPAATPSPTSTAVPTSTATPTGTATPSSTPTSTPTGTATPSSTPTSTATFTPTATSTPVTVSTEIITFDDLSNPNRPLVGAYPGAGIDWGAGAWYLSGPTGQFATNSVSFNGAGRTSAALRFSTPRRVIQMDVFNGGKKSSTISLSCPGQPIVQASLAANQLLTLITNWTGTCSTLGIESTNGSDTNFDSFVVIS